MKHPQLLRFDPKTIEVLCSTSVFINNKWVFARGQGFFSITTRLKYAWMVFTGRADALIWPEGQ